MKKQWIALFLITAVMLNVTGCSAWNVIRRLEAVEDRLEARLDHAEDQLEHGIPRAVSPAPAPAKAPASTDGTGLSLTEEQAREIALEYLGLTEDQVSWFRADYEIDDRIAQYDIELHQGDWEYELEIHAENGQILSFDKDHKYD